MKSIVKIGDVDVEFNSNAFTPIKYRDLFNEDLLTAMSKISDSNVDMTCIMRLAYVMATNTEGKEFGEWLSQFELMDFYTSMEDIIKVWSGNAVQLSKPKKRQGK